MSSHELVDILTPPTFEPSGTVKSRHQAAEDGDWVGTFNIWLYTTRGNEPMMFYQQRSSKKDWEPGKLDLSAGGHYAAGETGLDGLRELKEELGVDLSSEQIDYWGKKFYVGLDKLGRERRHVVSVYTAHFDGNIDDFLLDPEEISGLFLVPARALVDVFTGVCPSIMASGIDPKHQPLRYEVTPASFPFNLDNYHHRMAEHISLKTI